MPAYFTAQQKKATVAAGTLAGLETVRLIRSVAAVPGHVADTSPLVRLHHKCSRDLCRVWPLQGTLLSFNPACTPTVVSTSLSALRCLHHNKCASLQGAGSCGIGLWPGPQA